MKFELLKKIRGGILVVYLTKSNLDQSQIILCGHLVEIYIPYILK